ncbi:MAG: hypothetical protein OXG19_05650 [Chloroflexi bacterium]|nr:hypothetical protein [Chloroflexota bacterium]
MNGRRSYGGGRALFVAIAAPADLLLDERSTGLRPTGRAVRLRAPALVVVP